jgi:hypothetical protein
MNFIYIILSLVGFTLAYGLIYWRYDKEIKIRLKWMEKKLKKGRWKFPLALFIVLNLAMAFVRTIFSIVSDDFFFKPFMHSFFLLLFFTLFLFKFFYEIIGGKREWKI